MSILRRTRVLFKHIILVSFIIPAANTRVVLMMRYAELWGHLRSNQNVGMLEMLEMLEYYAHYVRTRSLFSRHF